MNKFFTIIIMFGVIILTGLMILPFLSGHKKETKPTEFLGSLLGSRPLDDATAVGNEVALPDSIKQIFASLIVVQSFSSGKLLEESNGLIISDDGFAVALSTKVPLYANAIQTLYDGKVIKAKVVKRDNKNNLVLLQLEDENTKAVEFKNDKIDHTSFLVALYRYYDSGSNKVNYFPVNLKEKSEKTIYKANYDPLSYGAAVVNQEGKVIGMIDWPNKQSFRLLIPDLVVNFWESFITANEQSVPTNRK